MADFKAALYTYLTATTAVTAQVSTRIYPMLAPATAATPYMTFQRVGYQEEAHTTGMSGLTRAPYQFDVWGSTVAQAEGALVAIRDAIDGYRGLMGAIQVERLLITSIVDGLEEPSEGQTLGLWRHTILADVWYQG